MTEDGVEDSLDQCYDTEYWNGETVNSNGCQDNQPTTPIQAPISTPPTQTPVSNPTSAPVGNIVEYEAEYATWDTAPRPYGVSINGEEVGVLRFDGTGPVWGDMGY